jgi:hypothetical protein
MKLAKNTTNNLLKIKVNTIKLLNSNKTCSKQIVFNQTKCFRDWSKHEFEFPDRRYYGGKTVSPYQPQFTLTKEEKEANDKLPVQERVLDFEKYMHHKGELKYSTGTFMRDVEPFPRLKIMMLCHVILQLLKDFDNRFLYKHVLKEHTQFIMEIVDQNEVLINIEEALIKFESLENLIMRLDDEITLLRGFLKNDDYKTLLDSKNEDIDAHFFFSSAFTSFNGTSEAAENTTHKKHEKKQRPRTLFDDYDVKI